MMLYFVVVFLFSLCVFFLPLFLSQAFSLTDGLNSRPSSSGIVSASSLDHPAKKGGIVINLNNSRTNKT